MEDGVQYQMQSLSRSSKQFRRVDDVHELEDAEVNRSINDDELKRVEANQLRDHPTT